MEWLNYISMLAKEDTEDSNDGFPRRFIVFIVIGAIWILGAVFKKIKDAAAIRQDARVAAPSRDDYDNHEYPEESGEKWQPVAAAVPPPIPGFQVTPPEHATLNVLDEAGRDTRRKDKSLGDLIKTRRQEPQLPSEIAARTRFRKIGALRSTATTTEQQEETPAPLVAFGNTSDLKQAMIFHEIFSSPKSLRHEREMWDG